MPQELHHHEYRLSRIRAAIFDMDGVLTNFEPLINAAAVAMFKEQGLVVQPPDFLPFVGAGEILTVLLLDSYPKQSALAYSR